MALWEGGGNAARGLRYLAFLFLTTSVPAELALGWGSSAITATTTTEHKEVGHDKEQLVQCKGELREWLGLSKGGG